MSLIEGFFVCTREKFFRSGSGFQKILQKIIKIVLELMWYFIYFSGMKKKQSKDTYENIKLKSYLVLALRVNKTKTGVGMGAFVEQAILEKFKRQNGK
jgi:hypothetical protein